MMKRIILASLVIVSFWVCSCSTTQNMAKRQDLKRLVTYMTGDFSSTAQSLADTNYYDIRLHIHPVTETENEYWLYVEQAIAKTPEKPYRQRIYRVTQLDSLHFVSDIFMIKNEKEWISKFKNLKEMMNMPMDIDQKKGCSVYLTLQKDNSFKGSTHEADCESSLRGAKYATSEVSITPNILVSWDRGFDDKNKQMWGAEKAGYNFIKSRGK